MLSPRLITKHSQVSLTQPVPPTYFGIDKKVDIFVVGSCNGLVCLHDNYSLRDVIWNPATKETKVVPTSNLPRSPATIVGIGFGFDAKTNDYKIIHLLIIYDLDPTLSVYEIDFIYQKEVYSLSADYWRKVDGPLINGYTSPLTYINGVASWRASCYDFNGVLSFDMTNEVFLKTPLPDDAIGGRYLHFWEDFFVLNESIAMAASIRDEEGLNIWFDMWLLLEVGDKNSWVKLFTIGLSTEIKRPLGFWKNETMFLEKSDGQLVLYDPSTKQMTNLQIGHGHRGSLHFVTYMETLVSIKRGNEFEEHA